MSEIWGDYRMEEFWFEDQNATIIYPAVEPNGKMVLKAEYRDAFPGFELAMLERGYYVINITHANRYAPMKEVEQTARFIRFAAEKLGASQKCIMVGMSAGGTTSVRLAQNHPELTAVLYLDAPLLNLLSLCGLAGDEFRPDAWQEMVDAYGFSRTNVVSFRESPIDFMDKLIENNIPIFMSYGNSDTVLNYRANGQVLENYYKEHGGTMKVVCCSMRGHHPHGLANTAPIVEFVEQFV